MGSSSGMGSRHGDESSHYGGSQSGSYQGSSDYQGGNGSRMQGMQDQAQHAREVADEWTQRLRSTVREHPLVSVAAAITLGTWLARRRR